MDVSLLSRRRPATNVVTALIAMLFPLWLVAGSKHAPRAFDSKKNYVYVQGIEFSQEVQSLLAFLI